MDQLPEDHTNSPDISLVGVPLLLHDLRGEVIYGSHQIIRLEHLLPLGQPEIADLHNPLNG